MEIEPIASFRQIDQTYIARRNDGSHHTRHFYEVQSEGVVTLFHGKGAAKHLTDCINQVHKSRTRRLAAANEAAPMKMAA